MILIKVELYLESITRIYLTILRLKSKVKMGLKYVFDKTHFNNVNTQKDNMTEEDSNNKNNKSEPTEKSEQTYEERVKNSKFGIARGV